MKKQINEIKRMQQLAGILKEEKSWDDVDKELADEEAQDMENARAFTNTTQGRNAVRIIKTLISKSYGYDKLDKVLQVLNLDRQNFIYAANQINGEWIVG